MKRSDVDDQHVIDLARAWQDAGPTFATPGVVDALVAEGVPEKLAVAKVMHMVRRRLLDYGVSPCYAWPCDPAWMVNP